MYLSIIALLTASKLVEIDLANEDSAPKVINTAILKFGGLHGLVTCAGVAPAEYAALVRLIVENACLNGEVIRLDGAIRLGVK